MSSSSLFVAALALCSANSLCGQSVPPAQSQAAIAPQIPALARALSHTLDAEGGLIKLDVVVTDKSGKPVTGLESTDLTLLDDGQPTKILSFQVNDGISAQRDPPVELILVINTLRMPGMLASHAREEVQKFLRRNDGKMSEPVSIFKLIDSGLWLVAEPSKDGNALPRRSLMIVNFA